MDETGMLTVQRRYGAGAAQAFRRAGVWGDDSLTEWLDRWAHKSPRRRAVTDGIHDIDYGTLQAQAYAVARWMMGAGVRPGDRIVIQLPNWAEFLPIYLGAARIGAVTVPIMMIYRNDEVLHIVGNSRAVLAVTTGTFRGFNHASMFRELRASAPGLANLMLVRESPQGGEASFENIISTTAAQAPLAQEYLGSHPGADQAHIILYSSGTESKAKGCVHTWNTLAFTARALAHEVFRMTPDDTMFMPSPVAHSTGVVIGLVTPVLAGSSIHLQDVWEPAEALRRIETYHCSITATATPFVTMALRAAASSSADLSSMRAWLCAGSPIPGSLAREFEHAFTNARLLPLYGCTEVLAATVCRLDDNIERISGSDGAAVSREVEIKLIDESGDEVKPGQPGEICYRGPGAILGYWADPERTAAAIDQDGWHHCGDLGVMDADGYLRITGRVKDIIIRGGQNISAREIEEHLTAHPGIREAAAVAYPDDQLGEKVCAYVVTEPGAQFTLESVREFLVAERRISVRKAPERLIIVDELPMTASGKVQKYILRDQLRQDRQEDI